MRQVASRAYFESHYTERKISGKICFPSMEPFLFYSQSSMLVDICPFALFTLNGVAFLSLKMS